MKKLLLILSLFAFMGLIHSVNAMENNIEIEKEEEEEQNTIFTTEEQVIDTFYIVLDDKKVNQKDINDLLKNESFASLLTFQIVEKAIQYAIKNGCNYEIVVFLNKHSRKLELIKLALKKFANSEEAEKALIKISISNDNEFIDKLLKNETFTKYITLHDINKAHIRAKKNGCIILATDLQKTFYKNIKINSSEEAAERLNEFVNERNIEVFNTLSNNETFKKYITLHDIYEAHIRAKKNGNTALATDLQKIFYKDVEINSPEEAAEIFDELVNERNIGVFDTLWKNETFKKYITLYDIYEAHISAKKNSDTALATDLQKIFYKCIEINSPEEADDRFAQCLKEENIQVFLVLFGNETFVKHIQVNEKLLENINKAYIEAKMNNEKDRAEFLNTVDCLLACMTREFISSDEAGEELLNLAKENNIVLCDFLIKNKSFNGKIVDSYLYKALKVASDNKFYAFHKIIADFQMKRWLKEIDIGI